MVSAGTGYFQVSAGAGSGKTACLVARTIRLIQEGEPPEDILTLSFTSEAAKNLRTRIEQTIKTPPSEKICGNLTFHSLGLSVCSREHENFPFLLSSNPLATEGQCAKIGYEVANKYSVNYKALRSWISLQKRNRINSQTAIDQAEPNEKNLALAYKKYDETLYSGGCLDFDSLILETVNLFESRPDVLDKYSYKWVMADECQDTDKLQYRLLDLVSKKHGNLLIVGDLGQAIYGFRGGHSELFRDLDKHFPDVRKLYLPTNYRSSKKIVEYVKRIAPPSELIEMLNTPNEEGVDPEISFYSTPQREAQEVADKIAGQSGTVAVLSRTNLSLRVIEDTLADRDIKYHYLGDSGFYNRPEVKSVLGYLQCCAAITDNAITAAIRGPFHPSKYLKKKLLLDEIRGKPAWQVLTAKVDRSVQEFVKFIRLRTAYRNLPPKDVVSYMLRDLKALEYYHEEEAIDADNNPVDNLRELQRVAARHDSLPEFLAFIRKVQAASKRRKGVTLATGHAAKGREWTHVFVIQCSEGMLPHKRATDLLEEQNLLYVMASRAEKTLNISYTGTPSRFLKQKDELFE